MGLILKLDAALTEQSRGKSTGLCYKFWVRKFYQHNHEDLNTTAIYLHADAARGVSPLDVAARPLVQPLAIGGF